MKIDANQLKIGNLAYSSGIVSTLNAIDIQSIVNGESTSWKPIEISLDWLKALGFTGDENEMSIALPTGDACELKIEYEYYSTCIVRHHTKRVCKRQNELADGYDYCYIKHPTYVHEVQNLFYFLSGKELELPELEFMFNKSYPKAHY